MWEPGKCIFFLFVEINLISGFKQFLRNFYYNFSYFIHSQVDYFQESTSKYEHIEVSTGGKLSRHNIHIQQVGPETVTELSTFHMCVSDQTQDLHSRLVLDHPRGVSQQIHKCIVAHSSGQVVFDGNVQVNRYCYSVSRLTFILVTRYCANHQC